MRRVDALIEDARRIVVLLEDPRDAREHGWRITLSDLRTVGRDDDEAVRREMVEERPIETRVRARTVAPRDDRMTEPTLREIHRPKHRERDRRAAVGADA